MLDNDGLIKSLIEDLNKLPQLLFLGQNIAFCDCVAKMGQKLTNLRTGVQKDMDSKSQAIEDLKNQLRRCGVGANDYTPEITGKKDGAENGSN